MICKIMNIRYNCIVGIDNIIGWFLWVIVIGKYIISCGGIGNFIEVILYF